MWLSGLPIAGDQGTGSQSLATRPHPQELEELTLDLVVVNLMISAWSHGNLSRDHNLRDLWMDLGKGAETP